MCKTMHKAPSNDHDSRTGEATNVSSRVICLAKNSSLSSLQIHKDATLLMDIIVTKAAS